MRTTIYLLAASLLIACGSSENESEKKTIIRYNEPGGITSLDPAQARTTENIWGINQIFNGLVQLDNELKVKPAIAHSWDVSDSGRVYTFYLRSDVQFHDNPVLQPNGGQKRYVTAEDFVYSFNRLVSEETASPGSYLLANLNKLEENNYNGLKALNDSTFRIYLTKPFPAFLEVLTMQYLAVVPEEAVKHYGTDFGRNPIGTGPFQFKMWKEGVKLVLTKNPNYFERDKAGQPLPYLDGISVTFAKDYHTSWLDFVKGNYDFMSGLNGSYKDEVLDADGNINPLYKDKFQMVKQPWLKTDYIGIMIDENEPSVAENKLDIKAVRQAINYAVNRHQLVKYHRNGLGMAAEFGFLPYGMPHFSADVKGYEFDQDKARQLLASVGFKDGEGLPEIVLSTTPNYIDICEYIQHALEEIGFQIKVDVLDKKVYREMAANYELSMFRKSWVADYAHAENFFQTFYSKNFSPAGPNYTHFKHQEFDDLYELSQVESNPAKLGELYRRMDQIIIEEAPVIPLFYDELIQFVHNDIAGWETNAMNLLNLKRVRKVSSVN